MIIPYGNKTSAVHLAFNLALHASVQCYRIEGEIHACMRDNRARSRVYFVVKTAPCRKSENRQGAFWKRISKSSFLLRIFVLSRNIFYQANLNDASGNAVHVNNPTEVVPNTNATNLRIAPRRRPEIRGSAARWSYSLAIWGHWLGRATRRWPREGGQ